MKYLFFIVLLFPSIAFAQKTFAPLGTVWNYEGHEIDCLGNHKQFRVEKEIMVDNSECSVIYAYQATDANPEFEYTGDSLIILEAPNLNAIYFLEYNTFYLMYNFNAMVGDTMSYFEPINRGLFSTTISDSTQLIPTKFRSVVIDISDIELSGQTRRMFRTEPVLNDNGDCKPLGSIIENIGSTAQGITGEGCNYVAEGCFGSLTCYRNDDLEFAYGPSLPSPHPGCDFIDDIKEIIETDLIVYPNPTSGNVFIESNGVFSSFELYDSSGQLLLYADFIDEIDLSQFETGIYFLKLKDGNIHFVERIVNH